MSELSGGDYLELVKNELRKRRWKSMKDDLMRYLTEIIELGKANNRRFFPTRKKKQSLTHLIHFHLIDEMCGPPTEGDRKQVLEKIEQAIGSAESLGEEGRKLVKLLEGLKEKFSKEVLVKDAHDGSEAGESGSTERWKVDYKNPEEKNKINKSLPTIRWDLIKKAEGDSINKMVASRRNDVPRMPD